MPRRLWGCYSVADHLEPRAFVADLLLYDRLVVPTPTDDDLSRWQKNGWDPQRQETLLQIADPFVERVPWNSRLRDAFESMSGFPDYSSAMINGRDALAEETSRWILSQHLENLLSEPLFDVDDVRAVAVYAAPDRFERCWSIERRFPFVSRRSHVTPGSLFQALEHMGSDQQFARLVVARIAVPDDGRSDAEVLQRTVDLVSRPDVAARRADLQEAVAALRQWDVRAETAVREFEDQVAGFNEAIKRRTNSRRAQMVLFALTTGEGAIAMSVPLVGLAAGPTAALGAAIIAKIQGRTPTASGGAVELLAAAKRALGN